MASEYSQEMDRSELDEPRLTTEENPTREYEGVSEEVPPHHRIHNDDEPLPKPTSETYGENTESYQDAPQDYGTTEKSTDFGEPKSEYGAPIEGTESHDRPTSESTEFSSDPTNETSYADSNSEFPGAPVDRKITEQGYGYDNTASETAPVTDTVTDPATEPEQGTKKESFMTKLKEKLPGHHKQAPVEDTTLEDDTTDTQPKKGLVSKIKEHLPGHKNSTAVE